MDFSWEQKPQPIPQLRSCKLKSDHHCLPDAQSLALYGSCHAIGGDERI